MRYNGDEMKLSTDLRDGASVPYFLWDEPVTLDELRERLRSDEPEEQARWAGKVMREARFDEAVELLSLPWIIAEYDRLRRHLGRRRPFWDFLLTEWRAQGLIA